MIVNKILTLFIFKMRSTANIIFLNVNGILKEGSASSSPSKGTYSSWTRFSSECFSQIISLYSSCTDPQARSSFRQPWKLRSLIQRRQQTRVDWRRRRTLDQKRNPACQMEGSGSCGHQKEISTLEAQMSYGNDIYLLISET